MKTGGIYPPVAKHQGKNLLLHCAHDNAGKRGQYTAANTAGDDLTDDAADIETAAGGSAKQRANNAAQSSVTADAANSTCKQLWKERHTGCLHKVANDTTTGSAGNSLDDEWKDSFHILRSRFISPNDLSSRAE
jgi:hypothetical protein